MKYEFFEIPIENMGDNPVKVKLIKTLLNKLHTHQDFCANEKIDITYDHSGNVYSFKLYKAKFLYINDKDATQWNTNELEMLAEKCPTTTFVSKYNKALYDLITNEYINKGKRIRKCNGCYIGEITANENHYTDTQLKNSYIYLTSVSLDMNRVMLTYKVFNIIGDNWDYKCFDNKGYHSCIITKAWEKSNDSIGFQTKEEFKNYINNEIKNALFEFSQNVNNTLITFTNKIEKL